MPQGKSIRYCMIVLNDLYNKYTGEHTGSEWNNPEISNVNNKCKYYKRKIFIDKSFPKDKLNIKDTLTLTPFTIRIERRRSSDDLDIAKSIKRQFSVENTQMALSLAGHFAYSLNEARFGNPHKVQHPLADRYSY